MKRIRSLGLSLTLLGIWCAGSRPWAVQVNLPNVYPHEPARPHPAYIHGTHGGVWFSSSSIF